MNMMMNNDFYGESRIDKFLKIALAIMIISIPFMNLPYMKKFMGELGAQGSAYVFIFIIMLVLIDMVFVKKRFYKINNISMYILIAFLAWVCISTAFNFGSIMSNTFKGRSGLEKLILQVAVLGFCILSFYCVYYIIKSNKLNMTFMRRFVTISFLICGIYSFMEVGYLLNIRVFDEALKGISYFVNMYFRGDLYPRGVRSICGEASYFAMFVTFAFPFIASYIYTKKTNKNFWFILLNVYLLILIFFSKSRIGYMMVLVQAAMILCYGLFLSKNKRSIINTMLVAIISIVMAFGVNNLFYNKASEERVEYDRNTSSSLALGDVYGSLNDENNMSNVARTGLWKAATKMSLDNPIKGVGLGQYGFNVSNYIDDDTKRSDEIKNWIDPESAAWPPAFSIHFRILAEFGFIGAALWIILWLSITIQCLARFINSRFDVTGMVIITLIAGVMMSGFNSDTFGFFPYYIVLAMAMIYIKGNEFFNLEGEEIY